MNKWRNPTRRLCAVAMPFVLLLLSGCGSSDALPDLESQRLDLSVKASDKVNPDNQKKAAPIEIRVYELKMTPLSRQLITGRSMTTTNPSLPTI